MIVLFVIFRVFYKMELWEARVNLKPSMANLLDVRVPCQQPNQCQVNRWFKRRLCWVFCWVMSFYLEESLRAGIASPLLSLLSHSQKTLIMNIAGFLIGFWSVHWRVFFVSFCKLCVCSCGISIFFFTFIPFHYLIFIKITFFFFMGGYI